MAVGHNWPVHAGSVISIVVVETPSGPSLEVLSDAATRLRIRAGECRLALAALPHERVSKVPRCFRLGWHCSSSSLLPDCESSTSGDLLGASVRHVTRHETPEAVKLTAVS